MFHFRSFRFALFLALGAVTLPAWAQVCGTSGKDGVGNLTGIVNTYYPGTGPVAAGATSIPVGAPTGSATGISAGDMLLVIQLQGASINSSNSIAYGDGSTGSGFTALNGTGKYEYVVATGPVAGGVVPILGANAGGLVNSYNEAPYSPTQGQATYEVVRVPQYSSATLNNGLTAKAWDGSTGGVLAVDVSTTLNLNGATGSVDGLGFRGAGSLPTQAESVVNSNYVEMSYPANSTTTSDGSKGEGIAGTPLWVYNLPLMTDVNTGAEGYPNGSFGMGAPGNAGGGGMVFNTGGGGGGNGGAGGQGGNACCAEPTVGGLGGSPYPATAAQMAMGGGGGAADMNNAITVSGSSGGPGGGMIFVRACSLQGTGTFSANGLPGPDQPINDGAGGGGAGGSVMVVSNQAFTGLTVNAMGARGANANYTGFPEHGPGGGGGGGVAFLSSAGTVNVSGGLQGYTTTNTTDYWGAQPGHVGLSASNLALAQLPGAQLCSCVANTPTSTPTVTPTSTPTHSPTPSPTPTVTYTFTITNTPTISATATNSPTNSPTSTATNSPTVTPTPTASNTATNSPTATSTSTATHSPTQTPTSTPTNSPTNTPTPTATNSPTNTPTPTATDTPCGWPGNTCTFTFTPTNTPTPKTEDIFYASKNLFTAADPVSFYVAYTRFPGPYSLVIYNTAGEHIKTLDDRTMNQPVEQTYRWDGTNKHGDTCASGVYVVVLTEPFSRKYKRILFVR